MTKKHRKPKESRAKENKKKSKAKRGKRIKNALKYFTISYQNIRGIKSKLESLAETVVDTDPTIICIADLS